MSGKEVLSMLKKNGWIVDRIEGSHYICIKNNKTVPVPVHGNKDLKKGTYKKIQKDARNAENS
ncbi:MAG: type II toxin-antitoxin system HicA family toxin [Bacteroidales bacterium]|nr:type II toxin-antitoxin system HicA family toxin [Bacteroidales bacterium]